MAKPVVEASALPESICGKDTRYEIVPMISPPYNFICYLKMVDAEGREWRGSGFYINLEVDDTHCAAIATSGHCTYIKNAYAKKITVKAPGMAAFEVGPEDMYAAPEYINDGSADHDYGLIRLPGRDPWGLGYTFLPDTELENRIVTNCGFPADKPENTMWITGGKITSVTADRIFYMNDTAAGQSGSPVYTWAGGYWEVVGIHSYGGCPNSAPRVTTTMISRLISFVKAEVTV
jgi:V8-like Glu-specific endopeptidase